MRIVNGDILDYASDEVYIAHQCNCWSKKPKHLSTSIFCIYTNANIYIDGTKRIPGNIIVRKPVINMLSQNSFGRAGQYNKNETYNMRRQWLRECLSKILDNKDIKRVCFPYGLGCGAAGDKWEYIYPILEEFNIEMSRENREVFLVKLEV